ncbi:phage/plasmid primase, P4 family [Maricaulis maris]|uniref:phage/plasmid primase, P4 family n=1 Tax=Maricaulis maris TaxID=74318 RepID=UPI002924675A|nr:hypothetical protein MACH15_01630 [Maricaulis maris]
MTLLPDHTQFSPLMVAGATYLNHGPVVPIELGGKRPTAGTAWKGSAALRSAADLLAYRGAPLNVAMRLDQFIVVDVDGDEGRLSLTRLEEQIGALPRSVIQISGSGGLHIFFRLDASNAAQLMTKHPDFPKIDFKAGPGHILVMAPSLHPSGNRYELQGSLADAPAAPAALLELLSKRQPTASTAGTLSAGCEGERHVLLVQHGVRLLNQGWDQRSIREALYQYTTTFRDRWTEEEERSEIEGVMSWLTNLECGDLFPKSATPVDIADWLKTKLKGEVVHLDNGDWLVKRENVFQFVRREQLRALFVRTLQPALADYERWLNCLDSEESRKAAQRKLDRLKGLSWMDKTIDALAAEPTLYMRVDQLDPPGVLNFKNGAFTLDGESASDAVCTKQLGVAFNPDATTAPIFTAFLSWALPPETSSTVLDIAGHALQRVRNSQFFWLFEGGQAAGKSTLLDTFADLFGSYAVAPATSLLFDKNQRSGGANEDLFALRGAAWANFPEGPEGVPLSPARCKTLTGGDKLSARPLYGHIIQFENKAEIVLMTNHETRLNVDDGGLRRRVKRVLFKNHRPEQDRDLCLRQKLLAEGEAIMNMVLAHARDVRERGISISSEIERDTDAYFARQDIMQQFIDERLAFAPEAKVAGRDVYFAYQSWCANCSLAAHSMQKFYRTFESKTTGVTAYVRDGSKAYRGVSVR